MSDKKPKSAQDEVSPWVLMKEGFLPVQERAEANIRRKYEPAPSEVAAQQARYKAAPNVGLGAGLSEAEIARRQAEISAQYQRRWEEQQARMAAEAAARPVPPEEQGYTQYVPKKRKPGY